MRIREAAETVGVSVATLRLWERQGLIQPPRSAGGNRNYGENEVALLRRVLYLRQVERLSPTAIARLLAEGGRATLFAAVPTPDAPSIGDRLRATRRRSAYTLKQVAEKTDLSVSFLSAVERGTTGLSISTLRRLTSFYGVTVLDLLDSRESGSRLLRVLDRPVLPTSTRGVRIEQLAVGTLQMEPQLFSVQPGAGSDGAYDHAGEEFIFALRGSFEIWLDEREHYLLEPGDSLYFPSTLPHRWRNPGPGQADLLWVNTPPTF